MRLDDAVSAAAHAAGDAAPAAAHDDTPARDTPARDAAAGVAAAARRLLAEHGPLPLPGRGATLARWRFLARAGGEDLSVAKVVESHADALAILADLAPGYVAPHDALWAVWAAEAPDAVLRVEGEGEVADRPAGLAGTTRDADPASVTIVGRKAWCSAAATVTHALVTARRADGRRRLCAVEMRAQGIATDTGGWAAVGMADTASATVGFDAVRARAVGAPDAYLSRPGFWHGGAGVAACWFGAARTLGLALHGAARAGPAKGAPGSAPSAHRPRDERTVLRALALGQVDLALEQAAAMLRALAVRIDAAPQDPQIEAVRRVRLAVDAAAREVLQTTLRALGPAPFCGDARLARLAADLPVFVRQCHGDPDLVAAGDAAAARDAPWAL